MPEPFTPLPPCLNSHAGAVSREDLTAFKSGFVRDSTPGRRWFTYACLRRCILAGEHSALRSWMQGFGVSP